MSYAVCNINPNLRKSAIYQLCAVHLRGVGKFVVVVERDVFARIKIILYRCTLRRIQIHDAHHNARCGVVGVEKLLQ